MGSEIGEGAEPRKSSILTFNWIRLYSAFSLQDAALASQGAKAGPPGAQGSTSSGLGVMATLPRPVSVRGPEALWRQRLQAGRWAVTHQGQQKPEPGKHRCPYHCRPRLSLPGPHWALLLHQPLGPHPGAAAKRVPCAPGSGPSSGHEGPRARMTLPLSPLELRTEQGALEFL